MQKTMNVRVEFEGALLKKLDALKAYYGIENYTDLMRFLVSDKHKQLFPKEA